MYFVYLVFQEHGVGNKNGFSVSLYKQSQSHEFIPCIIYFALFISMYWTIPSLNQLGTGEESIRRLLHQGTATVLAV